MSTNVRTIDITLHYSSTELLHFSGDDEVKVGANDTNPLAHTRESAL